MVGMVYPVWQIKTGMTVLFVIMWSLDSLLLYGLSWVRRSYTISSSSSASAANNFNFWSKVGCFVSFFLTCTSWTWPSLPRGCGCWTLSKPLLFSSCCFWQVLHDLLCSPSFLCYFVLTFSQLPVFLDFVEEDALAFAIGPNDSVSALGIRNPIHSMEHPPAPIFLSPLPSTLLQKLLSSAPVPSSSSLF